MDDVTAVEIAMKDLLNAGRKLERKTFAHVVDTYVRSGWPKKAVSLFKDVEEKHRLQWQNANGDDGLSSVTVAVHALCAKGHVREADGILRRHEDKVKTEEEAHLLRRLIFQGWCVSGNLKKAARIKEEMRSSGDRHSLASYHDFLLCICKKIRKSNRSALVPEAINVTAEMRASGISPTTATFNILLSGLGKRRRVMECCKIINSMIQGEEGKEATPDSDSYFIVIRLLYLTQKFDTGDRLLERMIEREDKGWPIRANWRFYHDLIGVLCGMENVEHALKLFERMKKRCYRGQENKNEAINSNNFGSTYDLLITQLCRVGRFELGRHLWDEASEQGINLQCHSDMLDPLKAPPVFRPITEKIGEVRGNKKAVMQDKNKYARTANISRWEKKNEGKKRR